MNDDEDQDVMDEGVTSRGVDLLTAAAAEAKLAGEPHLMYQGTFKLYADPTGALVLVVETPGQRPSVKVFSKRMVRMVSKMMPAAFAGG